MVLSVSEATPFLDLVILRSSNTLYLAELTDQGLRNRLFSEEVVPITGPEISHSLAQIPAGQITFLVSASVFLSVKYRQYIYRNRAIFTELQLKKDQRR